MERLQKFLSRAGVASRRHAETLIVDGRVKVNGKVATVLGTQVDPQKDLVLLDGKLVSVNPDRKYFLFYKPPGVVTTLSDPEGRPTVADYAQETGGRVFPVGRLDYDAEGALLLTDDGDLANKLMHPSHQVPRVYLAKVKGEPDEPSLQKLVDGVRLEDGMAHAVQARIFEKAERNTWVKIIVTEGRQHLVKRLCAAIGHPVVRLYRPAHAGLSVQGLRPGQLRALTNDEIRRVKAAGDGEVQPEPKLTLPARRHGHAAPGFEPEPEEEDTRPEGKRAQLPEDGHVEKPSRRAELSPSPRGGEGRGEGRGEGQPKQSRFGGARREARSARSFVATEVRPERAPREDRGGKFGDRSAGREERGGERSFGAREDRGGKFGDRGGREERGGERSFGGRAERGGKFGERSGGKFGERGGREDRGGSEERGGKFGDRSGGKFGGRGGKFGERGGGKFGERGGREDRGGSEERGGKFGERGGKFGERSGKFGERGGKFGERGGKFGERSGGKFGERGGREDRGGSEDRGGKFGERGGKFGERSGGKFGERGGRAFGGRDDRGGKFGDRGGRKTFGSRDERGGRSSEGQGPSQPASAPFPGEPGYGRKPRAFSGGDKPSGGFRRDDRSGPRFGGRGGKPGGGGFKKGGFKGGGRRG